MRNKALKVLLCIVVLILLVITAFLFTGGSLEMFSTEEQIEKGRIVYGVIFVALFAIEVILIRIK